VAADTSGVYVFEGGQYTKHDSRGNEQWIREFIAPAKGTVTLSGAAAAETGVYLVGTTCVTGQSCITFVRKYDTDGNELWTRQFEEPFYTASGVAADASGVYLAGFFFSGRGRSEDLGDAFVRKYSTDGAEVWTNIVYRSMFDPTWDSAGGVAVDATGVYVVGVVGQSDPFIGGAFVRKYSTDGAELWTRTYGQFDLSYFYLYMSTSVTADGSSAYVAVSDSRHGFVLCKYDASGNAVWTRQVVTSHSVSASAVAADDTGLYVVGTTKLSSLPGQCRSGSSGDAFVRKYDSNGAELWTGEFGTPYSASASSVAVDGTGVYAVGAASDASGAFLLLTKFEKGVAVTMNSKPHILPGCVVNAASYVGGGVAPGEIVTIFGSAMGPSELVPLHLGEDRKLATTLANTRILFNGVAAPLLYVSEKQSSAIVPYGLAGEPSVEVQVEDKGVLSDVVTVPVLVARPGIFTADSSGRGQGAILNEDGSPNSPSNPARKGSVVMIYATGGGESDPIVLDGQILNDVLPRVSLPVSAVFDNGSDKWSEGQVLYVGGVFGSVAGLVQLNVRVPLDALAGNAVQFGLGIGSQAVGQQLAIALR
jgi:uncharacterized protein (TIGR03437 family)